MHREVIYRHHLGFVNLDCVKAPGFDDSKGGCIELILPPLLSSNRGSFHASPNPQNLSGGGIVNKKEKIAFIEKTLDHYFPEPSIPLKHHDSFTLLIAVLLSAQATDSKVNEVTPFLFKKADTPEKMAKLSFDEVKEIIRTIGLSNTKAKAIIKLSQMLVEKWGGKVPNTFEELESLPGVGHKTASVVMVQSFDEHAFPVDTHIHRLAKRWGLSSGTNVKKTEEDLKKAFPKKHWGKVHLQMIYFGRSYCRAVKHNIDLCPICSGLSNTKSKFREL